MSHVRLQEIISRLKARIQITKAPEKKKDSNKVGQHASTTPTPSTSMTLKKRKPADKSSSKRTECVKRMKERKVDTNGGQNEILNFGHAILEGAMNEERRNESNSYNMDSKTSAFNIFVKIYPKLSSTYVKRQFNESEIRKTDFHVYLRILNFIASQSNSKGETLDTSTQANQKNVMSSLEEEILLPEQMNSNERSDYNLAKPSQDTTANPKEAKETETHKELWSFIFGDAETTLSEAQNIEDQIQNLAHSEAVCKETVFFDFVNLRSKVLQSFFQTFPNVELLFNRMMDVAYKYIDLSFEHQLKKNKLDHIEKAKALIPEENLTTRQGNCMSNTFSRSSAGTTREPKPATATTPSVSNKKKTNNKQPSPALYRLHATSSGIQKLKDHNIKRCNESLSNDRMNAQQNKFHDNTFRRDKLTEISSQLKSRAKKHRKKNKTKANVELQKLASQAKETGSVPDSRGLLGQRKYMKKSRMTDKSLKDGLKNQMPTKD